ncbi:tetratricopeptide repeat protein [Synechocystis sp. LKSZ1]|uniref:tetratricopeptide repeat protein n=1 Tax=Synechocystis sp. LKSZ1 TaxID=3144951 RepID=UPI00336BF2A1
MEITLLASLFSGGIVGMPMVPLLTDNYLRPFPLISQSRAERLEEMLIQGMNRGMKGDYAGAIAVFSQLIKRHPRYVEAYFNRGIAYGRMGQTQAAIADYSQVIRLAPHYAEAYHERGLLWQKLGKSKAAQQDFQQAARLYQAQGNQFGYQSLGPFLFKQP